VTESSDAPTLTPEQAALVERFAAELGCDPTLVLTVALRELAGRLHRFREHGEVRLCHVNPRATHVDWRPDPSGYVEFLREQFARSEPVPPPAVLAGHGAISGRHRMHAARLAGETRMLCYRVTPYPPGDPRHLKMKAPPPRGDDPFRALQKVPPGVRRRIKVAERRRQLRDELRRLGSL
jgi:hypothetical protein